MPSTLSSDNLHGLPGIRHEFFTRAWGDGGQSSTEYQVAQQQTRAAVAKHFGIEPANLLSCYQVHSPTVITVTEPWKPEDRPQADAMVTSVKNIALGVLTADCVPVLLADVRAGVIGAVHAGWRGALSGVLENTLDAMEKLGAHKPAIHAGIGPCIWQNSYEVGPEFPAPFLAENPNNERFIRPAFKSDHFMFDLPGYVEAKLRAKGVISVGRSPADTYADEARFFSFRRSTLRKIPREGNMISVIVLKE
jgi:YfiH family protein